MPATEGEEMFARSVVQLLAPPYETFKERMRGRPTARKSGNIGAPIAVEIHNERVCNRIRQRLRQRCPAGGAAISNLPLMALDSKYIGLTAAVEISETEILDAVGILFLSDRTPRDA
jgi:hypothetical protein